MADDEARWVAPPRTVGSPAVIDSETKTATAAQSSPRCWSPGPASLGALSRPERPVVAKAPCRHNISDAVPSAPIPSRFYLEFDDGTSIAVRGRGLIGRAPRAAADARVQHLVELVDEGCEVSRTHLEFDADESGLWVRDCASTNGSDIEIAGHRRPLEPGLAVPAPPGCTIHLAKRAMYVRAMTGRSDIGRATLRWGVATRVGAAREHNEDAYCAVSPVFVVADGMGGHARGELASRNVVESLLTLTGRVTVSREMFEHCLAEARSRIAQIPTHDRRAPGSTLSGVIVTQTEDDAPCWMVVNIGDSRTYRLDRDGLRQVSVDHSLEQELINVGIVRSSAAHALPYGHRLTRAVLANIDHQADVWQLPMRPGDRILVCSDGVSGALDDESIAHVLRAAPDPLDAATELVGAAVSAGSDDDATALVVDAVTVTAM
jgi:PPM family protein phosphatase